MLPTYDESLINLVNKTKFVQLKLRTIILTQLQYHFEVIIKIESKWTGSIVNPNKLKALPGYIESQFSFEVELL